MKKIAIVMGHFGLKSGGVLSSVLNIVNFLLKKNRIHIFAGKEDFKIPEKLSKQKNLKFTFFSKSLNNFVLRFLTCFFLTNISSLSILNTIELLIFFLI